MLKIDDPTKYLAGDVTGKLKRMKLKEGLNVIETGPEGLKLSVRVQNGQIAGYVYTDAGGKQLEGTLVTKQVKQGGSQKNPQTPPDDECFFCIKRGDNIICTKVGCPPKKK